MLTRPANFLFSFSLVLVLSLFGVAGYADSAHAQDEAGEEDYDSAEGFSDGPALSDSAEVRHGVGLRLRYIFLPQGLIELFMEHAPSGVSQKGFGFDYVRRKKDFEFSVGFEYDTLSPDDGYFVERGGNPRNEGTTDFIEFDGLSWYTIDAAIVYHHALSSLVSLRYGGGLGFGIVKGDIISTDSQCTGDDLQGGDCSKTGPEFAEKEDFFRYPPVFNVLGGVQLTPGDNVAINFEIGMRTVFYTGLSGQYFF
ncbi:MAG: hypothetical protein GY811_28700 [Myxococcales bacterium]|nr:hypothetical protein [Myxococcales bacterium]